MATVSLKAMLDNALKGGYAVGYFEGWDQYSVEAVAEAAEERRSPVIIGVGGVIEQSWLDRTGLSVGADIVRTLAATANVPVATLLNEVRTFQQIVRGITLGFSGVMIDTQGLPYQENVAVTRRVVDVAHAAGVFVEGELGGLPEPGPDGEVQRCSSWMSTAARDGQPDSWNGSHQQSIPRGRLSVDALCYSCDSDGSPIRVQSRRRAPCNPPTGCRATRSAMRSRQ